MGEARQRTDEGGDREMENGEEKGKKEDWYVPECLAGGDGLQADAVPVAGPREYGVAPPLLDGVPTDGPVLRILKTIWRMWF